MAFVQAMSNNKKGKLPAKLTTTENGALSHATTDDSRLNYFAKVLRDTSTEEIQRHLDGAWGLSPLDTMKLISQKRDCRGGSGEKKAFYDSIRWVVTNYPDAAEMYIPLVAHFGTWKDGFFCFCDTPLEEQWLNFVADHLKMDHEILNEAETDGDEKPKVSISLCAKWIPSEGSSLDKKFNGVYDRLVVAMGLGKATNKTRKVLRKEYITPLRQFIGIVESLMCGKQWDQIKYEQVPSVAMNRLRKAFERNDPAGFQTYLDAVQAGEKKINAAQLFPHDMVRHFMGYNSGTDGVLEAQWKSYVETCRELGQLEKCVVVSDVSSSMNGTPMEVSIAMGLLIATLTKGPFHGTVITFETKPQFFKVDTKKSLQEQVRQLKAAPWGGSTNFQAVFDMILKKAQEHRLKQEDMPETVVVVSDMQFNVADGSGGYGYGYGYGASSSTDTDMSCNFFTNYETIKAKYRKAGYDMPKIVFWNVRGNTEDFPVTKDEYGTAMVSGFSPCHLKYLTSGVITTPYDLMREAIDSQRYECVDVPDQYKDM
jgi:Mg-chelatase subunit ChlD